LNPGGGGSLGEYRDALAFGIKLVLLLILPALAIIAALSEPIVALVFQRNAFSPEDTVRTAGIFLFYSPQLPFTAIDYLLINAFYARQNARTPVLVGVVCVFIYLAVALTTIGTLGARGLALANAVQNSSHALILLVLLRRSLPGLRLGAALWPFLVRVVPTSGLVALALWVAWPALSHLGSLVGLLIAVAVAMGVYVLALWIVGVAEVRGIATFVRARILLRE
jgi:putative peptidoglycan lipid II flippase